MEGGAMSNLTNGNQSGKLTPRDIWIFILAVSITVIIISIVLNSLDLYKKFEFAELVIAFSIFIIAIIIICLTLLKSTNKDHPLELASLWLLGAIGLALIIKGIVLAIEDNFGVSFATIGIGCFLFSLALMSYLTCCSIPQDDEKRRRRSLLLLDRKEIRRSLAISFTILFILLIAFYFMEAERVVNYAINPLQPLDENRTKLAVEGLASLSNVITAFATIYVVIIGFYFGSRVYEKIKEIKNAEETLKIRYIMDDIEFDEFKTKTEVLKGLKTKPLLEIKAIKKGHKITIEHKGGDAIDLKNAKIKIEVNEKKAWIDFVAHACKKDVFEEEEKMEIDMDEIIKDGDDYEIKVIDKNGKPAVTGITRGSICNCITEVDLKNAGNNKVTVVFTDPTGEIINKKQEITIEGSP